MVSRFIRNCKTPLKCCIFALLLATQESSTCSESSLKVKVLVSHVQLFTTPWTVAHQALCPWGFSRQDYLGCHALLQGIFPIQGSNPGHLHCRQILYCWATREAQVCKASIWNINSFYLVCDLYDSAYIVQSNKWACMDLLKCIFQRKYKTPGIQVKSGWEVHLLSGNSVLSISAF